MVLYLVIQNNEHKKNPSLKDKKGILLARAESQIDSYL